MIVISFLFWNVMVTFLKWGSLKYAADTCELSEDAAFKMRHSQRAVKQNKTKNNQYFNIVDAQQCTTLQTCNHVFFSDIKTFSLTYITTIMTHMKKKLWALGPLQWQNMLHFVIAPWEGLNIFVHTSNNEQNVYTHWGALFFLTFYDWLSTVWQTAGHKITLCVNLYISDGFNGQQKIMGCS